jgi:hypothetical protein
MQRQDDYLITRTAMLMFIMQLLSLAGLAFRIAAQSRPVDDLLLRSFLRSEHVMLVLLAGIVSNTNTRGALPGIDEFEAPPDSIDRHAELIRLAATFQQIAMTLAMLLAMHPRAFRDRQRQAKFRGGLSLASLRGGLSFSSLRGGTAEPGVQRWEDAGLALASMTPALRAILHRSISGFRVRLRRPGMTPYLTARGPP